MAPPDGAQWVNTPCRHTQRNFLPNDYYNGKLPRHAIEIGYKLPTDHKLKFINCGHPVDCGCWPEWPQPGFFPDHPLVVASDGGVRSGLNGMSSIGVFVGPDSQHNVSEVVAKGQHYPSSKRAELSAAIRALQEVMRMRDEKELPRSIRVVLKVDCQDIQLTMISRIFEWKTTSYRSVRTNAPHLHRDLFFDLEEAVCILWNRYEVAVYFWWVPREYNSDADHLATAARDEEDLRLKAYRAQEAIKNRKRSRDDAGEEQSNGSKRPRGLLTLPIVPQLLDRGARRQSHANDHSKNAVIDPTGDSGPSMKDSAHGSQSWYKLPTWMKPSYHKRPVAPPTDLRSKGTSVSKPIEIESTPSKTVAPLITAPAPRREGGASTRSVAHQYDLRSLAAQSPSGASSSTGGGHEGTVESRTRRSGHEMHPVHASKGNGMLEKQANTGAAAQPTGPFSLWPGILPKDWTMSRSHASERSQHAHGHNLPTTTSTSDANADSTETGMAMSSFCLARHGAPITLSPVPDRSASKSTIQRLIPSWAQSQTAKVLSRFQGLGKATEPVGTKEQMLAQPATSVSKSRASGKAEKGAGSGGFTKSWTKGAAQTLPG